jgi:hypothetical protein
MNENKLNAPKEPTSVLENEQVIASVPGITEISLSTDESLIFFGSCHCSLAEPEIC